MKKIGFVIPWYGDKIPGGAEADLRGLAKHMVKRGVELEILTTCVREFLGDWGRDYHKPGVTVEGGVTVRRFRVKKRNANAFAEVNLKLMHGQYWLSKKNEQTFVNEMVNSTELYEYIREHKDEYGVFVFTPYMFGTTYFGVQECLEKAVLIPCFHDETYAYMKCFQKVYSKVAGIVFHAKPERELIERIYDLSGVKTADIGDGMDVNLTFDGQRFRDKYHIHDPYILYAGRKDVGKNIYTLIEYFREYKYRQRDKGARDLKLVLLGGGTVEIPQDMNGEILDLGFVPVQDKYDAYGAASVFCQPSHNESFSLVIMESWLCERPVLVSAKCAVTKNFVKETNGGLYFDNYWDFEGAVDYLLTHEDVAKSMGKNGKQYVTENFAWDIIVDKYLNFFEEIAEKQSTEEK